MQPQVFQLHRLDHAFLCDESDTDMRAFLEAHNMKRVLIPFPSTAENIALWLLDQVDRSLTGYTNLQSVTIRLQETERTYAEVTRRREN